MAVDTTVSFQSSMDCHACTAVDCALGAPMPPFHSWEVAVCLVGLHYNACSLACVLDPEACWSVAVAAAAASTPTRVAGPSLTTSCAQQ